MKGTKAGKLVAVARSLMTLAFACAIVGALLTPGIILTEVKWDWTVASILEAWVMYSALAFFPIGWTDLTTVLVQEFALILLYEVCCICAAIILWQGRRVLISVLAGETFSLANAANMRRAAVCCFVVSGAALAWIVWTVCTRFGPYGWEILICLHTLLFPVFLLCGLVCIVISALFRQAAAMKAEQDLTI